MPANADPFALQEAKTRLLHLLPMLSVRFDPPLRAEDICVSAVDGGVARGFVRRHRDVGSGGDLDVADDDVVGRGPFGRNT